jgi:cell division protein FtsB
MAAITSESDQIVARLTGAEFGLRSVQADLARPIVAIQETSLFIEKQQAEIESLKRELEELKAENKRLRSLVVKPQ